MLAESDLIFDNVLPQGINADAHGKINDLLETDYRLLALITSLVPNLLQLMGVILVIGGIIYATGAYKIMIKND